jgi:hypothetical protein
VSQFDEKNIRTSDPSEGILDTFDKNHAKAMRGHLADWMNSKK